MYELRFWTLCKFFVEAFVVNNSIYKFQTLKLVISELLVTRQTPNLAFQG